MLPNVASSLMVILDANIKQHNGYIHLPDVLHIVYELLHDSLNKD